ncbi:MAG: DNA-processing protein DprA [Zhengella sp.]|uniref:DNA-processing protein DprA n=1 Tax=Zhengella sp. TaxID=2282762 RepID=UPI001D9D9CCE|nr:DNA-processing protein DprA [Notoacmeibacter sp.]MCC0028077.1 DNA-protecting protein DprA [Brucellaceae bacterium]
MDSPARAFRLSDRQRLQWLRLIRTDNVGPATFRELINRYGSAGAALDELPELAARGGARKPPRIPHESEIEREIEAAMKAGAIVAAIGEAEYPAMLKTMPGPPPVIMFRGDPAVFALPACAIVGARNASLSGVKMARMLARDLAAAGHAVISGLARGIDTAAHEGALEGGTVAVLAGGLSQPYPPENVPLMEAIVDRGGAVISEMPFHWQPRAQDFPRRNRLIAGLAFGLVVVEAALRSGSLISARLAGEMGRAVFAVPGSPLDPRAGGSNRLLKNGASVVTEADDIIDQIAPMTGGQRDLFAGQASLDEQEDLMPAPPPGDDDRSRVIQALGPSPVHVDEVIRHTGLKPAQVQLVLIELDLAGRLERHAGNQVSIIL